MPQARHWPCSPPLSCVLPSWPHDSLCRTSLLPLRSCKLKAARSAWVASWPAGTSLGRRAVGGMEEGQDNWGAMAGRISGRYEEACVGYPGAKAAQPSPQMGGLRLIVYHRRQCITEHHRTTPVHHLQKGSRMPAPARLPLACIGTFWRVPSPAECAARCWWICTG